MLKPEVIGLFLLMGIVAGSALVPHFLAAYIRVRIGWGGLTRYWATFRAPASVTELERYRGQPHSGAKL